MFIPFIGTSFAICMFLFSVTHSNQRRCGVWRLVTSQSRSHRCFPYHVRDGFSQSVNFGPFRPYQNKLTERPEIVRLGFSYGNARDYAITYNMLFYNIMNRAYFIYAEIRYLRLFLISCKEKILIDSAVHLFLYYCTVRKNGDVTKRTIAWTAWSC